jgi:hypothetical protein
MNLLISIVAFIVTVVSIGYDQPIPALVGIGVLVWQELEGIGTNRA